jgi:hypothetical protein
MLNNMLVAIKASQLIEIAVISKKYSRFMPKKSVNSKNDMIVVTNERIKILSCGATSLSIMSKIVFKPFKLRRLMATQ